MFSWSLTGTWNLEVSGCFSILAHLQKPKLDPTVLQTLPFMHTCRKAFFLLLCCFFWTESALRRHHLVWEADAGYRTIRLLLYLISASDSKFHQSIPAESTLSPLDWFSTYLSSYWFLSISSTPLFIWYPPRSDFRSNRALHLYASTRPHHSNIQYHFHFLHCYADDTLSLLNFKAHPNCQRLKDLKITWAHNGFMSNELKNMLE